MCGYRDYMLDKYIQKIHPYGYVCVVYIQHEEGGKIGESYMKFTHQQQHLLMIRLHCPTILVVYGFKKQTVYEPTICIWNFKY